MNKKICIFMIICLVILVSACGYNENDEADEDMSIQVNAVRKSEDANSIGNEPDEKMQTWQSAYLEILYHLPENLAPQYEPDGTNSRSSYYYNPLDIQIYLGLHDFDDDGILELIVGDLEGMAVFTYKDGQVEKIADLYFPDIIWCINGVDFKDNSISIICSGAGGNDYINFGYLEGEYVLGLYGGLNVDYGVTINGVEGTLEEMNRIYTLNYEERGKGEHKERLRLVWENETWVLKYTSGKEVVLNSNFDFDSILW